MDPLKKSTLFFFLVVLFNSKTHVKMDYDMNIDLLEISCCCCYANVWKIILLSENPQITQYNHS
jgi:hypothetical protein